MFNLPKDTKVKIMNAPLYTEITKKQAEALRDLRIPCPICDKEKESAKNE